MSESAKPAATAPEVTVPGGSAIQPRPVLWLITLVAVGLSLFQLYSAGIQPLGLFYQRSIHLMLIMMLAFLIFPVFGPRRRRGVLGWALDGLFLAGALLTGGYLVLYLDEIFRRAGFWTQTDIVVGCIATLTVLEASRRAVGLGMTIIGAVAIPTPSPALGASCPGWASGCPVSWSTAATTSTGWWASSTWARRGSSACRWAWRPPISSSSCCSAPSWRSPAPASSSSTWPTPPPAASAGGPPRRRSSPRRAWAPSPAAPSPTWSPPAPLPSR